MIKYNLLLPLFLPYIVFFRLPRNNKWRTAFSIGPPSRFVEGLSDHETEETSQIQENEYRRLPKGFLRSVWV